MLIKHITFLVQGLKVMVTMLFSVMLSFLCLLVPMVGMNRHDSALAAFAETVAYLIITSYVIGRWGFWSNIKFQD